MIRAILCCFFIQIATSQNTEVCLNDDSGSVTNNCLGCICEASTRCDLTTQCDGSFCGPFYITKGYWIDGGKCVLEGDSQDGNLAYEKCSIDVKCASRIIRSYMTAFAQDCNGDGLVTCDDYAMIHKNGGWSCSNPIQNTEYWKIYSECKALINGRGENI